MNKIYYSISNWSNKVTKIENGVPASSARFFLISCLFVNLSGGVIRSYIRCISWTDEESTVVDFGTRAGASGQDRVFPSTLTSSFIIIIIIIRRFVIIYQPRYKEGGKVYRPFYYRGQFCSRVSSRDSRQSVRSREQYRPFFECSRIRGIQWNIIIVIVWGENISEGILLRL